MMEKMKNKLLKQAWIKKTQRIKRPKYPKARTKYDNMYRPLFCDIDQCESIQTVVQETGKGAWFYRPKLNTDLH